MVLALPVVTLEDAGDGGHLVIGQYFVNIAKIKLPYFRLTIQNPIRKKIFRGLIQAQHCPRRVG